MSQSLLLIDYEPRTVARVTEALAALGCQIATARDVDSAVASCAKTEPKLVLITSVLPRIKIEDAITQLRARAGLRSTPILVLMSGYTGEDPQTDAQRIGAQDILPKPFSNDELVEHVKRLLSAPKPQSTGREDSRADVLDALRRSVGLAADAGTVTSQELFGDLIEGDAEPRRAGDTQRIPITPVARPATAPEAPPAKKAPTAPKPPEPDTAVERALETTLANVREGAARGKPVREDTGGASVDELLSQTLSGLQVQIPRGTGAKPATPPAETPRRPEPEPAPTVRIAKPVVQLPTQPKPTPARTQAMPMPLPGGTPFGQYELMETIATGGMAEVYKARMQGVEGFQKIVAIKRILPHLTDNDEFVTMFIDEAKLAAQLQHPNIIHIYDLGKIERSYYIAMEYIDGKDLRSLLRLLEEKQTRIPLGLALYIGARLAAALDYAHRKHDLQGRAMALVHRDVSPQNVLISFDGDIKLCDFGIAKAASKASHTRAGALKGKLQYMSPEQAWGKDIDNRSDIFSLGLVLYEMVTGRKAFAGDSELSILEQVRSPRLTLPRDVDPSIPPEVERVLLKALKENRDDRYQTAADLAGDLDGILQTIRPHPGASELGSFLAEVMGRERAASAPAAPQPRPAVAPPAEPLPPPPKPVVIPAPPPPQPAPLAEVSQVSPPPRRTPIALITGLSVVLVAVIAIYLLVVRQKPQPQGGATAAPTAVPGAVELARQIAAEEMAKQQAEASKQERPNSVPAPAPPEAAGQAAAREPHPTAAPARAPAASPRERPTAAAAVAPTAVPAAPSPVPAAPTAVPTAAPSVEPTQPPPPPTEAPVATRAPLVAPVEQVPAVKEGDLLSITQVDSPPEPISSPKPAYPPVAERQRVGGSVILSVLVDERGAVDDVKVLRGIRPDFGLDAAAVSAVRRWRYKPATKNGVKVKVWYTQTIAFQLQP